MCSVLNCLQNDPLNQEIVFETLARIHGESVVPIKQQIMIGSMQNCQSNLAMSVIPNRIHPFNGYPLASPQGTGPVTIGPISKLCDATLFTIWRAL